MTISTGDPAKPAAAPRPEGQGSPAPSEAPPLPDPAVGAIMQALKAGQTAADNGPTWAMVYVGSILILGTFVLFGILAPRYTSNDPFLDNAAPYAVSLIVGSGLILLAGTLRLLNEVSLRQDTQRQTKAYYEELDKARVTEEKGQTEDIEAIQKGAPAQGDGNQKPRSPL